MGDEPNERRFRVNDDNFDENVRNLLLQCDELDHENESDLESVDDSDADPDYIPEEENISQAEESESETEDTLLNTSMHLYCAQEGSTANAQRASQPSSSIQTSSFDQTDALPSTSRTQPIPAKRRRTLKNQPATCTLNHPAVPTSNQSADSNPPVVTPQIPGNNQYYFGRSKNNPMKWEISEPPRNVRTPQHNIIRGLCGLTAHAKTLGNKPSQAEIFAELFDDKMLDLIILYTNRKFHEVRVKLGPTTNKANYKDIDKIELKALLGIFLYTSVFKSSHENMLSMFSKDPTGRPIFLATFSVKRFEIILMCLRFDDRTTRNERVPNDRAALISELFNAFIFNSQKMFCVKGNVTVDEMLIPFRGRCPFRQYMPKKPAKYGIKVLCLADSGCGYLHEAFIYTDKDCYGKGLTEREKTLKKPTQCVIKLTNHIQHTNRNVTTDNWFTSIELSNELRDRGFTLVGTVRKSMPEVPAEFLPTKTRPVGEALYGFNASTTMVSFVPIKNKSVVLLSTMHHSKETDDSTGKPEIITYYNKTKGGVDLLDMKCANYSCSRRTNRWPMAVFYMLVNAASVNAFILFLSYRDNPLLTRLEFVKRLGFELIEPHLRRRLQVPNLRRDIRKLIQTTLGEEEHVVGAAANQHGEVPNDRLEKRKTCSTCPSHLKRKTAYCCVRCSKAICLECSRKLCLQCAATN